jgi:NADH-quinone oxidoreductase subunit N
MPLDNYQSLRDFLPETILSLTVLVVLTVDLIAGKPNLRRTALLTLAGIAGAFIATLATMRGAPRGLFGGLIARDPLSDFFKIFFLVTTALIGVAAMRARDAIDYTDGDKESAEFYTLTLTTTIGMFLMAASTDLLTAFLSLETVSIMSYVLSGFKRRNRQSSEASLKYVVYGGVASGVMLYGMSLLYGIAGATSLSAVRAAVTAAPAGSATMVTIAVILCLAGFGYKIASVPFHMWCPDVYQGAPTPVTAFLSVGPKAAGFALLIRFFGGAIPPTLGAGLESTTPWPLLIAVIAVATMTLGNLAALQQTNLKRLFAYSSIAHAGYLLLGLCVTVSADGDARWMNDGNRAILLYLLTYLFMNIGAFVVIIALADGGLGEELLDYRGLGKRAPFAALTMAVFLFSLTGLPPFAGFLGKYFLFAALVAKGGTLLVTTAVIGVLNSAVSLFYYARILKAMYLEAPPEGAQPVTIPRVHAWTLGLMAAPTLLLLLASAPVLHLIDTSLVQWFPSVATAARVALTP